MNPMSMPDADFPEDDDMDAPRYSRIVFDPTSHHASAPHSHSHSHSHSHIMTSSGSTRDLRDVTTSHLPQPHLMSSYSPMCTLPSSMQPGMPSLPAPGMPSLPAPGMQHAAMIPSHALYTPRHSLSSARHDSVVYPFRTGIDERNPVYSSSQFRQYRNRQEQRPEKDTAIWPPELENPFLDGKLTFLSELPVSGYTNALLKPFFSSPSWAAKSTLCVASSTAATCSLATTSGSPTSHLFPAALRLMRRT